MPTYEYRCPEGHEFERFQKMSDPSRAKCPVCGKLAARRISGGAGLIFKGSGFYITDYGKDGKGPRPEKEAAGSTGETESKPAEGAAKPPDAKAPGPEKSEKKPPKKKASS